MPADESPSARGTGRSRASAAISRALTPRPLTQPAPVGIALRSRPATGPRRPPAAGQKAAARLSRALRAAAYR
ncbi:MAG TPA: putative lipid II flippase FtsW, partial [Streptomyces sp.]|nr:putative lipid II flippase FtsW [Streptomyces sp.]